MVGDEAPTPDDDRELHGQISPKERVDAILSAPHLTRDQAVAALDAQFHENQATFPHLVICRVFVTAHITDTTPSVWVTSYFGPFDNRHAAEAWATSTLPLGDELTFEVAKVETAEMYERSAAELRRILDR